MNTGFEKLHESLKALEGVIKESSDIVRNLYSLAFPTIDDVHRISHVVGTAVVSATEKPGFKFIDLFCGIGGFHQALASFGGTCVLACDIDEKCREVYLKNYGVKPEPDVTKLDTASMPDFDVLCGGFPCQAFSHSGKQLGFTDTRGTLFRDVARILKDKQPKFFLLENVKNLKGHDGGRTWNVIYNALIEVGYVTYETPTVLSPHQLGVPQHRERVLIMGVRKDLLKGGALPSLPSVHPTKTDISSVLEVDDSRVDASTRLSTTDINVLGKWEEFVQHFKARGIKLPTFPIWTDYWASTETYGHEPDWKQKFINQNKEFYTSNSSFLGPWLTSARALEEFKGARRKFEWQCGAFKEADSLWNLLFQFRPSGIRVKRKNYSPALVAMAQIVYVGEKRRKLTPREVARLQSFPDSFLLPASSAAAYKQFGNAVNVEVIKWAARHMFSMGTDACGTGL
jgi:DNA (cytosine-5)-methyltransferase 1